MHEASINSPSRALPVFVVIVVLALVFGKFAVVDRLMGVASAQDELDRMNSEIAALQNRLAVYSEVEEAYVRFGTAWMTDEELALVDRTDMLALLEREIVPAARIGTVTMQGSAMTVELLGITLEDASDIVRGLEQDELVTGVGVSTASTVDEQGNTIPQVTLTILCTNGYTVPVASDGEEAAQS